MALLLALRALRFLLAHGLLVESCCREGSCPIASEAAVAVVMIAMMIPTVACIIIVAGNGADSPAHAVSRCRQVAEPTYASATACVQVRLVIVLIIRQTILTQAAGSSFSSSSFSSDSFRVCSSDGVC